MRLLYLDNEGIDKVVKEYERDTKAIKEELFKICWFMRGGVSLTESYIMTMEDRAMIAQLIEENLKITKDSGLPFF
jgi:hypothetical protein